MESHWERTKPHQVLDIEHAREILRPLGFIPTELLLLGEGKVNTNYLVETQKGPVVLRLQQGSDAAIELEEALAKRLYGQIPAPHLLAKGEGCLVFEWRKGNTLEKCLRKRVDLPYPKIARQLAAVRRALDKFEFPSAGLLASDLTVATPWPSAVMGHLARLTHYYQATHCISDALMKKLEAIFADAEPRLQELAGTPVLTHGDFKPTNFIVDEMGLAVVLDWEFAHAGTWLSDVGQILRHPNALPPGFTNAFLDELKAPADTMLLARTLDLVNLVHFLSTSQNSPIMKRDVEARISELSEAYEKRFMSVTA